MLRRDLLKYLSITPVVLSSRGLMANSDLIAAPRGTCLLLLDLQRDFLAKNARFPIAREQIETVVAVNNRLVEAASSRHWKIVAIYNSYSPWDLQNLFRSFAAIRNSSGAEIDARVNVTDIPRFSKTEGNAFSNPSLNEFLRSQDVGSVVLTGVFAEACVLRTARGALRQGYKPIVVEDGVGGGSAESKSRALKTMSAEGIEVKSSLALLDRTS